MQFGEFSRRKLFGAGVGFGLASAAPGAFAQPAVPPATVHRRTLLMRGLLREGLVVSALKGTFYAVEGGHTTPLHGAVMCSFMKHLKRPDGSIETRTIEVEWYTDLDGNIFDQWKNPFTQEMVPPPERRYFRNSIITGADLSRRSEVLGDRYREHVVGWREEGDDVWMLNELSTLPAPGKIGLDDLAAGDPTIPIATELGTYHARRSELDAPGVTNVRIESYHSCEGAFRPWQKMGDHPGYLLLLVFNRSLNSRDELPPEWVAETEKHFPELLRSPEKILDA